MPWTRPRFWPTWLTRLQSDGGWAIRLRLRLACRVPPLPPALPCLRPRGSSQGEGREESFPCHFARPPLPTRHPDCAAQAAAGQRGLRAVEARGDHQGSEGAQLPLATPFSYLPGLLGVPLMPLVARMAVCMDIAGPVGTKLFLLPLLPTEVPGCRGAPEGLSLAEWMVGEMRDGPGFLVQYVLEFI